jgi:hypothetical protein
VRRKSKVISPPEERGVQREKARICGRFAKRKGNMCNISKFPSFSSEVCFKCALKIKLVY